MLARPMKNNAGVRSTLEVTREATVDPIEAIGWDGDLIEANAFAFMAVRSLNGLPLSFPGTTGVKQPATGGTVHRP